MVYTHLAAEFDLDEDASGVFSIDELLGTEPEGNLSVDGLDDDWFDDIGAISDEIA